MKHSFGFFIAFFLLFPSSLLAEELSAVSSPSIEKLFDVTCKRCHVKGQAGAPLLSDEAAWQRRWKDGGKARFKQSLVSGRGKMPKQGGCFQCSDQDFDDLIEYIILQQNLQPELQL